MTKQASVLVSALVLIACGSSGGSAVQTQLEPQGSLGEPLLDVLERHQVPAIGAYAFDSSGMTGSGVVGRRRADADPQVGRDDRWHLGSSTKAMTATLAARLDAEGVISLDATMSEAFPELEVDPSFADVTLAELLMHRGGAPDHGQALYQLVRDAGTPSEQRAALAAQVLEAPAPLPHGDYAYSNVGYAIVGAALEQATGGSWESLLAEYLFEPLGMSSCGFGPPDAAGDLSEPWGHVGLQPVTPGPDGDNPVVIGPAGTVHCSLEDWGKFAVDQLRGAQGEAGLLVPSAYVRLHTPPVGGDYALGWGVIDVPDGTLLTHTGSNTNFTCIIFLRPDNDLGLLLVANRGDDEETMAALEAAAAAVGDAARLTSRAASRSARLSL